MNIQSELAAVEIHGLNLLQSLHHPFSLTSRISPFNELLQKKTQGLKYQPVMNQSGHGLALGMPKSKRVEDPFLPSSNAGLYNISTGLI